MKHARLRREDDEHSTLEPDLRSKAWPRVLLSLAIVGMMVGLMIGRLTAPQERVLEQVEVVQDGLDLWFNDEPKLHGETVQGTVAVVFQPRASPSEASCKCKESRLAGGYRTARKVCC